MMSDYNQMPKEDKSKENLDQETQRLREQALNKKETEGKKVNPQLQQKQEHQQPRDSA